MTTLAANARLSPDDDPPPLPWLERLLIPLTDPGLVDADARKAATERVAKGKIVLGSAIDPQAAIASLDEFVGALRVDPTCVPAYQGIARALQAVARARPDEADAILTHGIRWTHRAVTSIAGLQRRAEAHDVEGRLRAARREVRSRPRATGRAVRVKLERDAEGRVVGGQPLRLRPSSGELRALVPGLPPASGPRGPELPLWGFLGAGGLLFIGVVGALKGLPAASSGAAIGLGLCGLLLPVLIWLGQRTAGLAPPVLAVALVGGSVYGVAASRGEVPKASRPWEPGLAALYPDLRLRLALTGAAPTVAPLPTPLAVVHEAEAAERPLRADPLHDRLPARLRADGTPPATLVVVRRMEGDGGHALLLWFVDAQSGDVFGSLPLLGPRLEVLEGRAITRLTRLASPPE